MPGKKSNKKNTSAPKEGVKTPEATGPKTEIAERIESQVGALVGSTPAPDNRWFFQKMLPIGYGGRDAPTSAPTTVTPTVTPVLETPSLADPEGAVEEEDEAEEETPVEATPKPMSKSAKKHAKQREKKQVVLRAALLIQMKATATEQLEKLKSSDEWARRTERIAARYPDDKTKQTELTRSMSVTAWKQLRAEAVAAETLVDVKLVITKIEAMSEAVHKLEQGERFQIASAQLASAPPQAMTKPYAAPLDGDDHAKPVIEPQRVQHILHGDATGGRHGGEHMQELPSRTPKPPDRAMSGMVVGDFKSFFPPAWSEQDVLDAIQEAAAQTFDHRVAQPKAEPWHQQRYKHPAWKVTLHRVPINVVVITEDKKGGGYQVITGHPA
ncbi:MAG: EndoU domain-containing protein [Proteobacteria bacterium]|nr:EndoU domain-containing protein [Pseudomonadota bacterium]